MGPTEPQETLVALQTPSKPQPSEKANLNLSLSQAWQAEGTVRKGRKFCDAAPKQTDVGLVLPQVASPQKGPACAQMQQQREAPPVPSLPWRGEQ